MNYEAPMDTGDMLQTPRVDIQQSPILMSALQTPSLDIRGTPDGCDDTQGHDEHPSPAGKGASSRILVELAGRVRQQESIELARAQAEGGAQDERADAAQHGQEQGQAAREEETEEGRGDHRYAASQAAPACAAAAAAVEQGQQGDGQEVPIQADSSGQGMQHHGPSNPTWVNQGEAEGVAGWPQFGQGQPRMQQQHMIRQEFPTPGQLGENQASDIRLSDLTTRNIVKVAAEAAEEAIAGKLYDLNLEIGPPKEVCHPLIAYRKPVEWKIFVAHVQPTEILKVQGALAGLCRIPSTAIQFLGIRNQAEVYERLPRKIGGQNLVKNHLPEWVTAEYKISANLDWRMIQEMPQFQRCTSFMEFHALISAVEKMLKMKWQIEALRCYEGNRAEGVRLDYRTFRNNHPGVVYVGFPNQVERNMNYICGWHPHCGIDWSTQRREYEHFTMPAIYKD